jgi:hypothetical protein
MATLTQSLLFSPILKASSHGSHADTRMPGSVLYFASTDGL